MVTTKTRPDKKIIEVNKKILKIMLIEHISRNNLYSKSDFEYYDRIFNEYGLKNI